MENFPNNNTDSKKLRTAAEIAMEKVDLKAEEINPDTSVDESVTLKPNEENGEVKQEMPTEVFSKERKDAEQAVFDAEDLETLKVVERDRRLIIDQEKINSLKNELGIEISGELPEIKKNDEENNPRAEELDMPEVSLDKKIEISDIIKNEFAYQDVELSEETKKKALDWSSSQENSKKYAEAFSLMLRKRSLEEIEKISYTMVEKCNQILDNLGIKAGPYSKSRTWAMWDIAKQFYFLTHQEEADKKYTIGHPIDSTEKQKEIIDRHVGWEVYGAYRKMTDEEKRVFLSKFTNDIVSQQISLLLNKIPKMDNTFSKTLSSLDLSTLGNLVSKQ
jgi:hypothetical protein